MSRTQHGVLARRTATDRPATSQARDWVVRQVDGRMRRGSDCFGIAALRMSMQSGGQTLSGLDDATSASRSMIVLPRPKLTSLPSPVTASSSVFQIQPPMFSSRR